MWTWGPDLTFSNANMGRSKYTSTFLTYIHMSWGFSFQTGLSTNSQNIQTWTEYKPEKTLFIYNTIVTTLVSIETVISMLTRCIMMAIHKTIITSFGFNINYVTQWHMSNQKKKFVRKLLIPSICVHIWHFCLQYCKQSTRTYIYDRWFLLPLIGLTRWILHIINARVIKSQHLLHRHVTLFSSCEWQSACSLCLMYNVVTWCHDITPPLNVHDVTRPLQSNMNTLTCSLSASLLCDDIFI